MIIQDASWRPDTENLAPNEKHRTLLGAATDRGDYAMVHKLLEAGVLPNSRAKDEQSCLTLAIGKGEFAICRRLIAAGAKINTISTISRPNDLRLALESGSFSIVQALLQHPRHAYHLDSSFEADLKFATRRYAKSACPFEIIITMVDKVLERPDATDPESPYSKVKIHAIYEEVLRATCQRARNPVMHRTTDQRVNTLDTPFITGDLNVIELLLRIRPDIKPSMPEVSANSASSDSKLIQLLLDRAENVLDPVLESVYPRFSGVNAPRDPSPRQPPVIYPAPTSQYADVRELRFGKVFPLAVHHGTWGYVLKRLLDKSLHLSNREVYMDKALQRACYLKNAETLRILLDWCRDSPLKCE
jgi:hypothetical protein